MATGRRLIGKASLRSVLFQHLRLCRADQDADSTPLALSDARARADAILDSNKRFVMPLDATVNIRQGNRFEEEKAQALKNARNAGAVPSRA